MIVALVLDKGASTSTQDHQGRTALHLAVGGEHEIIRLLVAKGALVDALDRLRQTPLHLCSLE
ncbi:hypothetical protein K469DRAFT_780792 [Zopfia rhizophila CBS 207.26]|uniref:Uncharacterized protein n=1 Tax=Zopfia rhizophila CBS 207.26 TaxID=1314779 RepID=A0A6A6E1Z2_9PEZI|nr:hypothetical protein K469DRAFT_780792 [Zopfia rhizophila CBS 207.26]